MAWIEVHQALVRHRKLYPLAEELRIDRMQALGHLIALWLWAIDNAEDGDLTEFSPAALSEAACWRKKPREFVAALELTGWIDVSDGGSSHLHDWSDYAGRLIDRRRTDRERKRIIRTQVADGARTIRRLSSGQFADGPQTVAVNRTVPNPTVPAAAAGARDDDPVLTRCTQAYDGLMGSAATTLPLIAQIRDWIESMQGLPYDVGAWFEDACTEAALHDGRNLKYVLAILKRWKREGRSNDDRRGTAATVSSLTTVSIPGVRGIDWEQADALRERMAAGDD